MRLPGRLAGLRGSSLCVWVRGYRGGCAITGAKDELLDAALLVARLHVAFDNTFLPCKSNADCGIGPVGLTGSGWSMSYVTCVQPNGTSPTGRKAIFWMRNATTPVPWQPVASECQLPAGCTTINLLGPGGSGWGGFFMGPAPSPTVPAATSARATVHPNRASRSRGRN